MKCHNHENNHETIDSNKFFYLISDTLKKDEEALILNDCIIEEIDIYKIYSKFKDDKDLSNYLNEEPKDSGFKKITLKIPIKIKIIDSEINSEVKFYHYVDDSDVKKDNRNGDHMEIKVVFEKELEINNTIFKGKVSFWNCKFKENFYIKFSFFNDVVDFGNTKFSKCLVLYDNIFKNIVDFSSINTEYLKIEMGIFESIVRFSNISCDLVAIIDTIFNETVFFSVCGNNKDGINLFMAIRTVFNSEYSKIIHTSLSRISFLLTDIENLTIVANSDRIFDDILFEIKNIDEDCQNRTDSTKQRKNKIKNNKHIKNLLKKSFNNDSEKLIDIIFDFDEKTSIYFNNDRKFLDDIVYPNLKPEVVLKEYRSIRKSFEKKRTYTEASELFIYEMDLLRRITTFDEKRVVRKIKPMLKDSLWYIYIYSPFLILLALYWMYFMSYILICLVAIILSVIISVIIYFIYYSKINTIISRINTIVSRSTIWIVFWIYKITSNYGESIIRPIIITIFVILVIPYIINHSWNPPNDGVLFEQTLRAFFQLGIDKDVITSTTNPIQKEQLKTLASYEWLIRIISLILLGSLFMAIKRRLERK